MPAIFTTKERILNALNFKDQSSLYVGIGRTTPWDDENNPPTPVVSQITIEELIYIKKLTIKHLVQEATVYETPDVQVGGVDYMYILDADAYTEGSSLLYVSATILYSDIAPTSTTFRQAGILLDPEDGSGVVLTSSEYLAAAVGDQGQLLYVDNFEYITRDPVQSEKFEFILTF